MALGSKFVEFQLRMRSGHNVVIGSGPAAKAFGALSERKCTHLAAGFTTRGGSSARLDRVGDLDLQLRRAGASRAHQIIVDDGDDATTWATATQVATALKNISVDAYIADSWTEERLIRSSREAKLRTFSYASGGRRQVMLAHPPYLLARHYEAAAQHILVIGFGMVGQSLVREFLATSVSVNPERMMVTIIDKDAIEPIAGEFLSRMPGLKGCDDIDMVFLCGGLRNPQQDFMNRLKA